MKRPLRVIRGGGTQTRQPNVTPSSENGLLERGVWTAPFLGPRGETILVAIDRDHRHVRSITVPPDIGLVDVSGDLWAFLDRADPPRNDTDARVGLTVLS